MNVTEGGAGGSRRIVRVLLVDDQALLRRGLRLVLDAEPDVEVVGEAGDGSEALAAAERLRPDVVLMDVRMPVLDGISAARRLTESGSPAHVIILTTFDLDEYVHGGLQAGAAGFLLKDCPPEELVRAVLAVAGGDAVLAPAVTRRVVAAYLPSLPDPARAERRARVLAALTPRELDVLAQVATGATNREIAARLHIAEGTVKIHVGRILAKLDLRDRVQAVVLAYEAGLVHR